MNDSKGQSGGAYEKFKFVLGIVKRAIMEFNDKGNKTEEASNFGKLYLTET